MACMPAGRMDGMDAMDSIGQYGRCGPCGYGMGGTDGMAGTVGVWAVWMLWTVDGGKDRPIQQIQANELCLPMPPKRDISHLRCCHSHVHTTCYIIEDIRGGCLPFAILLHVRN